MHENKFDLSHATLCKLLKMKYKNWWINKLQLFVTLYFNTILKGFILTGWISHFCHDTIYSCQQKFEYESCNSSFITMQYYNQRTSLNNLSWLLSYIYLLSSIIPFIHHPYQCHQIQVGYHYHIPHRYTCRIPRNKGVHVSCKYISLIDIRFCNCI